MKDEEYDDMPDVSEMEMLRDRIELLLEALTDNEHAKIKFLITRLVTPRYATARNFIMDMILCYEEMIKNEVRKEK